MMNQLEKLYHISKKKEKIILGLMSGTSLDGLDMALCKFTGSGKNTRFSLLKFETQPYQHSFKEAIKKVFSKKLVDLEALCILNESIALTHAAIINSTLKNWQIAHQDVDVIASHGQTIYHAPASKHQQIGLPNATLQIGDGDHIAVKTGIVTISDFRQKNIAAGGEGAPLAVYGDYILFGKEDENRVLLNIGGIANFTFLPAKNEKLGLFSTDVGPGNTLMDQFMQKKFNRYFDEQAQIAKTGNIHQPLLNELLANAFFELENPKSTGPELFNLDYLAKALQKISPNTINDADIMATLCEFTACTIAQEISKINQFLTSKNLKIYASGGGAYNPLLMERLQLNLPHVELKNMSELGVSAEAKEAVLFALLANETLAGEAMAIHPNLPSIAMGKISLPK